MVRAGEFAVGQEVWVATSVATVVATDKTTWRAEKWHYLLGDEDTLALVSKGWGIGGNFVSFCPRPLVFATNDDAEEYCRERNKGG